ncbi:MarR family transcriptional regulator [Sphingomonas sp. Root710]|uniref:MarR family winged helix-turn-helix transcriptional regulator n=1 Tax=Sphingomonas sp. Root710 TaxID=1736594 RepID=UPI000701A661|nr:MarR family winged helix-turn-helix transcriptional regulator [Sphingomonas sp. Root710]KRB85372.1 MarR family transcriptional regulator [Sphingomonas sp. Root710]
MNENDRLLRDFGGLFLRIHRLVDRRMAAEGASLARTKLLLYLQKHGPCRAADIAELLGATPRTITEAIDGLEREGLAVRTPHPTDRRAKLVSITANGERIIEATEPLRAQLADMIFERLDQGERDQLTAILAKLSEALNDAEPANICSSL